jgi:predicted ABC-type ATPase
VRDRPALTIVGGPNGVGKSTLSRVLALPGRYINPDLLGASEAAGARVVLDLVERELAERSSFALESTLSGRLQLRLAERAQTLGYRVDLIFIGCDRPEHAMGRVRARVAMGGHDIPEDDQRRRFARVFENGALLASRTASVALFDNETADGHRLLALKSAGVWTAHADPLPVWTQRFLA